MEISPFLDLSGNRVPQAVLFCYCLICKKRACPAITFAPCPVRRRIPMIANRAAAVRKVQTGPPPASFMGKTNTAAADFLCSKSAAALNLRIVSTISSVLRRVQKRMPIKMPAAVSSPVAAPLTNPSITGSLPFSFLTNTACEIV